jgi:hypothetical protein
MVGIAFDSYFDQRTAFIFGVTAGGIKFDMIMTNNGASNEDKSWDPNWWVRTSIDDKGWVAEMRIPFSQLRFERTGVTGFGAFRSFVALHRKGEMNFWSHIPKGCPGNRSSVRHPGGIQAGGAQNHFRPHPLHGILGCKVSQGG